MKTKSNSGFSLVELMVVVAIIGILATVGGPNFLKYQRKAKQTNAKTELSGVYTSEKAFYVEYSEYSSSLSKVGYQPEGFSCTAYTNSNKRNYTVGFASNLYQNALGSDPCDATNVQGVWAWGLTAANPSGGAAGGTAGAASFTAAAVGAIGGATSDVWTVNNNNDLKNATSGI